MAYTYQRMIAFDEAGIVLRSGTGQVYSETDPTFATPLVVTDLSGIPKASIGIDSLGLTDAFICDEPEVIWKSGAFLTPLSSSKALREAAESAAAAAQLAAQLVQLPVDNAVATLIQGASSATRLALVDLFGSTGGGTGAGVDLTTDQEIDGVKTFSQAPVVPDDSFTEAAIAGLVAKLAQMAIELDEKPSIVNYTTVGQARPDRPRVWWIGDLATKPTNMLDVDVWTQG